MKRLIALAAAFLGLTAQAPPPTQPPLQLWRLDCGSFAIKQYGAFFSDTFQYPEGPKDIVASCYLIRNGDRYLLWDTGLTASLIGKPLDTPEQHIELRTTILDQLKRINVRPDQIEMIGISHYHFDHLGQARSFPGATLLIGKADLAAVKDGSAGEDTVKALQPWLGGTGKVEGVSGDKDVFGDKRVIMLDLPGHTPGHHALLVRLASGPVLLSGDLYHFTEQVANKGVPPFNTNRADTLASIDRFDRIAKNLGAKVIIQHEPADIAKLPAFPEAAR